MWPKINAFLRARKDDLYVFLVLILVALLAFGLGRLSVLYGGKGDFRIIEPASQTSAALLSEGGGYLASKTGSIYYLPWCGSASRIKPENLVRFATKEEAERAGYQPSTSCNGI